MACSRFRRNVGCTWHRRIEVRQEGERASSEARLLLLRSRRQARRLHGRGAAKFVTGGETHPSARAAGEIARRTNTRRDAHAKSALPLTTTGGGALTWAVLASGRRGCLRLEREERGRNRAEPACGLRCYSDCLLPPANGRTRQRPSSRLSQRGRRTLSQSCGPRDPEHHQTTPVSPFIASLVSASSAGLLCFCPCVTATAAVTGSPRSN
ncbi:hypothetical protein MRX96_039214 [Rhipicephalus microplus]